MLIIAMHFFNIIIITNFMSHKIEIYNNNIMIFIKSNKN